MRVLYAVHALPAAGYGGTELYTQQVAETVAGRGSGRSRAGDHAAAVATPAGHGTDVAGARVYALPDARDWTDPSGEESGLESGVVDPQVDRRFVEIMDDFEPDVVHLQHVKRLSATLPRRCAERGVPCLATLHDFWTVCHRERLVRPSGARCSGPESVAKCAACYDDALRRGGAGDGTGGAGPPGSPGGTTDPRTAVARRAARLGAARGAVDLLVAPSAFLRERFLAFGTPPEAIVHRRNGVRVGAFADTGFDPGGPLRLGYAGRVTAAKGVHVLLSAFERVEGDAALHVFGRFEPDDDRYHARLAERAGAGVTFHGEYGAASAPYEAMDVLVLPSLWYENSPLVIQEAFASRVPVVAGDVGGMAELVEDGVDGLTVPVGDAGALARALGRLADAPATVERLRAGIDPPKSLDEHVRELLELYEACRDGHVREVGGTA